MLALTHPPSPLLSAGQRTFVARQAIDAARAAGEHAAYCRALVHCGLDVRLLAVNATEPDGVFLEDTAVVLDEVAVICSMGTPARRREPAAIEPVLAELRPIERIELPAMLEGGDVLRVGRKLLVGRSPRTNAAGIDALARIAGRYGYEVSSVGVRGCLHLKTACTVLPVGCLVVNPAWIDIAELAGYQVLPVPAAEPWGANVLPIGERVVLPAEHPQTAELIEGRGLATCRVELAELAKAEGGVTCLSILIATEPLR